MTAAVCQGLEDTCSSDCPYPVPLGPSPPAHSPGPHLSPPRSISPCPSDAAEGPVSGSHKPAQALLTSCHRLASHPGLGPASLILSAKGTQRGLWTPALGSRNTEKVAQETEATGAWGPALQRYAQHTVRGTSTKSTPSLKGSCSYL